MGQGVRRKPLLHRHSPLYCISLLMEIFFHYPQKENSCMRKRIASLFFVPMLLLTIVAFTPTKALAAAPHSIPHFFLKQGQTPFASNLTYHGGPVMGETINVYAIFWEPTGNVET